VVDSTADSLNSAQLPSFVRVTGNDGFRTKSLLMKCMRAQFFVVRQFSHRSAQPSVKINVSKTLIVKNQTVIGRLQLSHIHVMTKKPGTLHFHFMGEYSKLDRVKMIGTRGKINAC